MLALTLLALAAAPGPAKIAIPNFSTINVPPDSASFFLDRFANRLRAQGLSVTTATEMQEVLGLERKKALTGCTDDSASCSAELAAALGVDAILRARLAKFGLRYEATFTLIDSKTAGVLASATDGAADEAGLLALFDKNADHLAQKLLAARSPDAAAALSATPEGRRPLWVALTPGVLGVAAGAVGALFLANSFQKVNDLATARDPVGVANSARFDRALGLSLVGAGVAALATSVVLVLGRDSGGPQPVAFLAPELAFFGLTWSVP